MRYLSRLKSRFLAQVLLLIVIAVGLFACSTSGRQTSEPQEPLKLSTLPEPVSLPSTGVDEARNVQIDLYDTLELVFTASVSPENPFDTYLLKIEVTDPVGTRFVIDGFYDGDGNGGQDGNTWKARLTPYLTGTWSWRTVPGDQPDPRLENISGQFECLQSANTGGLVAEEKYFRFQNGEMVYPVGNFLDLANELRTTHTFMSETTDDSQRNAILERQRDFHNVNKANLYFANKGDYDDQSVTPWLGNADNNDKTRMDLARWQKYDQYILLFKENGILAELWFFADDSRFGKLPPEDKERLVRYAMARTSAFSHTYYVLALEWQEGWKTEEVNSLGSYLQAHNPWGRLVSVHSHQLSEWAYSGQAWASFIASQAGNDSPPDFVNSYSRIMDENETIPHLSEEFGYLRRDTNGNMRSKLWANFCGGAAGSGTGSDLKSFQGFIAQSRIPFQRMHPANTLVTDGGKSRFARVEPGHHYLVYSSEGSFELDVSGENLSGQWFNPRDPTASLGDPFAVSPGSQSFNPPSQADQDWVLWITDSSNLTGGITHPTPGKAMISIRVDPGAIGAAE